MGELQGHWKPHDHIYARHNLTRPPPGLGAGHLPSMFLSARGIHHILKFAIFSDVLTSWVEGGNTYSGQTTLPRDS